MTTKPNTVTLPGKSYSFMVSAGPVSRAGATPTDGTGQFSYESVKHLLSKRPLRTIQPGRRPSR